MASTNVASGAARWTASSGLGATLARGGRDAEVRAILASMRVLMFAGGMVLLGCNGTASKELQEIDMKVSAAEQHATDADVRAAKAETRAAAFEARADALERRLAAVEANVADGSRKPSPLPAPKPHAPAPPTTHGSLDGPGF